MQESWNPPAEHQGTTLDAFLCFGTEAGLVLRHTMYIIYSITELYPQPSALF